MARKMMQVYVIHPEYGNCTVYAPSAAEGIQAAAKMWDVPWTKIAAYCDTVMTKPPVIRCCAKCGVEVYGTETFCGSCQRERRQQANDYFSAYRPELSRRK